MGAPELTGEGCTSRWCATIHDQFEDGLKAKFHLGALRKELQVGVSLAQVEHCFLEPLNVVCHAGWLHKSGIASPV